MSFLCCGLCMVVVNSSVMRMFGSLMIRNVICYVCICLIIGSVNVFVCLSSVIM